ncbi:MAG: hypothetical protein ACYC64_09875 [Armatimonadota bacterium]
MTKMPQAPTLNANKNANALKHGILADRTLSADERPLFDGIIEQLYRDFTFNESSDFLQVELIGIYQLKLARAIQAGDSRVAESLDRMIRAHLRDLKATKNLRDDGPKGLETTPAQWAASLVEKFKKENKDAGAIEP